MIDGASGKLFLIVDNLKVHHAVKVKEWLTEHRDAIELCHLPPDAPEHNPDEHHNDDPKQRLKNLPAPDTQHDLARATTSVLHSLPHRPARIRTYFHAQEVRYAASYQV